MFPDNNRSAQQSPSRVRGIRSRLPYRRFGRSKTGKYRVSMVSVQRSHSVRYSALSQHPNMRKTRDQAGIFLLHRLFGPSTLSRVRDTRGPRPDNRPCRSRVRRIPDRMEIVRDCHGRMRDDLGRRRCSGRHQNWAGRFPRSKGFRMLFPVLEHRILD